MDIELDQTFVAHLQKEGLASFRIRDIGAPHDLVDCERLLAESASDQGANSEENTFAFGRSDRNDQPDHPRMGKLLLSLPC